MSSVKPTSTAAPSDASVSVDSARALRAITRIHLATDPPQLLEGLMHSTAAIGATASIYTIAIPEDGPDASSFSLFACHPRFAQRQCRLGTLLDHPWFEHARTHFAPTTEHQLQSRNASDEEALELARQYGFASSLIVPTPSSVEPGRIEMLCLGSERAGAFEGEDARLIRTLARSLAAELHDWMTRHLCESLQSSAGLHQADIELLKLEWQGLSTKEISLKTGMSAASVDSRFQRLNVRLACPNRKASARRAAAFGLLEAGEQVPLRC